MPSSYEERARTRTKQLRIYPSSYEKLRVLAFKHRCSLAAIICGLVGGSVKTDSR